MRPSSRDIPIDEAVWHVAWWQDEKCPMGPSTTPRIKPSSPPLRAGRPRVVDLSLDRIEASAALAGRWDGFSDAFWPRSYGPRAPRPSSARRSREPALGPWSPGSGWSGHSGPPPATSCPWPWTRSTCRESESDRGPCPSAAGLVAWPHRPALGRRISPACPPASSRQRVAPPPASSLKYLCRVCVDSSTTSPPTRSRSACFGLPDELAPGAPT